MLKKRRLEPVTHEEKTKFLKSVVNKQRENIGPREQIVERNDSSKLPIYSKRAEILKI